MADVLERLQPGDIVCVRTRSIGGWFIRLGAWLSGLPAVDDHVIVVHHIDANAVVWGISGQPGGVAWDVVNNYNPRYLTANIEQYKTDEQRAFITQHAELMLKTAYDWEMIAGSAIQATGSLGRAAMTLLVRWKLIANELGDKQPAKIVCSSFAVWLNHHAGLAYPDQRGERWTTPADWVYWIRKRGWRNALG